MRKFLAILILICVSWQYMLKLSIVAWYQINKDYIAQTLCENRDKPEKNCCGKCYLKKQLKKADKDNDDTEQSLPTKLAKAEVTAFVLPVSFQLSHSFSFTVKKYRPVLPHHHGYEPLDIVFQPPTA